MAHKITLHERSMIGIKHGEGTDIAVPIFAGYHWHCWHCRRGGEVTVEGGITGKQIESVDGKLDCPVDNCEEMHRRRSS